MTRARARRERENTRAHGATSVAALRQLFADESQRDRATEVLAADVESAGGALFFERAEELLDDPQADRPRTVVAVEAAIALGLAEDGDDLLFGSDEDED